MVNHKHSTVLLVIFLFLFLGVFLVSAFSSEDLDDICSTDDKILYRSGFWDCASISDLVNGSSVDSSEFILRNGSNNLTADWDAGNHKVTVGSFAIRDLIFQLGTSTATVWTFANHPFMTENSTFIFPSESSELATIDLDNTFTGENIFNADTEQSKSGTKESSCSKKTKVATPLENTLIAKPIKKKKANHKKNH